MATNKDHVDVPDYDADVNEFAEAQRAAAEHKKKSEQNPSGSSSGGSSGGSTSGRSSRSRGGRSSRSTKKDEQQDEPEQEDDSKKRDAFTATLERGYRRRMNGMVHHAQTVGKPDNVASISDYVNLAIAEKLARDEKRLNNGQPFPEPVHMRTGRPQKRR